MTGSDRFAQFQMEVVDNEVLFYKEYPWESKVIRHDILKLSVTSIDSPTFKSLCPYGKHYGAKLCEKNTYRKIFFLNFDEMNAAIQYILTAQKCRSRRDQYQVLSFLNDSGSGPLHVVQHFVTGKKFVLKEMLADQHELNQELMIIEVKILQKFHKDKHIVQVLDIFEDESGKYAVTNYYKHGTLEDLIWERNGSANISKQDCKFYIY